MKIFQEIEYINKLYEYFYEYEVDIHKFIYDEILGEGLDLNVAEFIDTEHNISFIKPKTIKQAENLAYLINKYLGKTYNIMLWNHSWNQFQLINFRINEYDKYKELLNKLEEEGEIIYRNCKFTKYKLIK